MCLRASVAVACTYDELDRLTIVVYPNNSAIIFTYHAAKNRLSYHRTSTGFTLAADRTSNGLVTRVPARVMGEEVSLTPMAGAGYQFTGWIGGAVGDEVPLLLAMGGHKAVAAHFIPGDLLVPKIVSPGYPTGTVGQPFFYQILVQNSPATITANNLLPGVALTSADRSLEGLPSERGIFEVELTAETASGTAPEMVLVEIIKDLPGLPYDLISTTAAEGQIGMVSAAATNGVFLRLPAEPNHSFG